MTLNWDTGLGKCSHCGELIQLHTYRKKDLVNSKKEYSRPQWKNNTGLSDGVVKYFEGRGISQFTLRRAKVTEEIRNMPPKWERRKVICFNYFRDGELINVKYRTRDKQFMLCKDAELIMYNLDLAKISEEVVITEGEIDTLSYMEAGIFTVISLPNGSTTGSVNLEYIDNCIPYLENKKRIYLSIDDDEPGRNVCKELIRRFGADRCLLIDLKECKDANEFLIKYGAQALREAKEAAAVVPIEDVSSLCDWKEPFENYLLNGMRKGYLTGIESFDKIFSTYTGQYIVVTGKPSSGKSDFVDMMCLGYNRRYGWKIAIASPENQPYVRHAGKIISKICGMWVNKAEYFSQLWYGKAVERIDRDFKYIDFETFDLESVLDKARDLIFRYGIKVLVIDPFNKVRLKSSTRGNVNEYTSDYLIKIDEFAKKHDILIFLVAHPNKPSGDEKRNYEPDFYSIKGGGEFYDMSPHGLLVHRDYENKVVKIKVLKVKFSHLGENNAHVWLRWNEHNGRYNDFKVQHKNADCVGDMVIDMSNWVIADELSGSTQISIDYETVPEPRPPEEEPEDTINPSGLPAFLEERNDMPF